MGLRVRAAKTKTRVGAGTGASNEPGAKSCPKLVLCVDQSCWLPGVALRMPAWWLPGVPPRTPLCGVCVAERNPDCEGVATCAASRKLACTRARRLFGRRFHSVWVVRAASG